MGRKTRKRSRSRKRGGKRAKPVEPEEDATPVVGGKRGKTSKKSKKRKGKRPLNAFFKLMIAAKKSNAASFRTASLIFLAYSTENNGLSGVILKKKSNPNCFAAPNNRCKTSSG